VKYFGNVDQRWIRAAGLAIGIVITSRFTSCESAMCAVAAETAPQSELAANDVNSSLVEKAPSEPQLELVGRLDTDFIGTAQSADNAATFGELGDVVGIRRAWIGAEGHLEFGRYVSVIDLASGDVVIRDLFIGIGNAQETEYRFGHYLEPYSQEVNTASFTLPFMECSVGSILAPARNWGASLCRLGSSDSIAATLGVFQAGSDPNDFERGPGSTLGVTGRFTAAPVNRCEGEHLVHMGMALSARLPEEGTVIVNQQPQNPLLDFGDVASSPFIPQIEIPAGYQQLSNLQFAAGNGPYWTHCEWYGSWIDQLGGPPVFFHGFYVSCGWFLTGEHRPYQEASGSLGPVKVSRPVYCRHTDEDCELGLGAWELAARFALLDLQDRDTQPGPGGQAIGIALPQFTLGLNWYLTDHVRLMGNYSCALPDEPNTGTSVAHLFGMRIGVFW